jgi:PAS domain S-box-containing protein
LKPSLQLESVGVKDPQILWDDGERILSRGRRAAENGAGVTVLVVMAASERLTPSGLPLTREFELRDDLDAAWAARPLELIREGGRTVLLLEDPGGEPLARHVGTPLEIASFLRVAIRVAAALGKAHHRGLVHRDLKPANILINCADGEARLTGFGIASRLPRERQALEPPETIAGTLAYMAPEQTGRMNRSVDSRSDLYSLGVTFYQMLIGSLPFSASDPIEWVHCHIARRPVMPSERLESVPPLISRMIMKLLAKTAEERYQTAAGLESDLRRCLAAWEAECRVDDFPLGEQDTSDQLLVPEKLYGRARELETLLAAFDRVVNSGTPELALVSGYSGVGKSSVVSELHKALLPSRALFASGKFDQYKRDIPYSTLVQAFRSLVRSLLGKSDAELAIWRNAFSEALGPNAGLIVDLVPELKIIIGDQPPVPELEPQQAQSRFQLVFGRFVGAFARPEHPLVLFLDDLQWLDAATLDLFDGLLTQSDLQHLMLIGAYRDNEVNVAHPLIRKVQDLRNAGAKISQIIIAPLSRDDVQRLIVDALRCERHAAAPLAQLAHDKTAGNPFFVIQFLHALAEEELLCFNYDAACWSWNLDRIRDKGYTENVVDLMIGKLTRLPVETQQALQQLACLGNVAEITMLSVVLQMSEEQVRAALWPAVRQELVERRGSSYRFSHDRVQEAAYSMIRAEARAVAHLLIGRLLAVQTPPEKREEAIFDIVNQLNRGAALIAQQDEREQLAELNLIAAKRAKVATAYASALNYLAEGARLLPEECWARCHRLAFAIEINRAECEYLLGELASAEERLAMLSARAQTTVDSAAVTCMRINLYTTLDQSDTAVGVGLEYLSRVDGQLSRHPTAEDVHRDYDRLWEQLGSRSIEALLELPPMREPERCATIDVLTVLTSPSLFTDLNLFRLVVSRMSALSLEHGNADGSCLAYAWLGGILGTHFGDYQAGLRFGRLGIDLVEKHGLDRFRARVYLVFAVHVADWTQPLQTSRTFLRRAFDAAQTAGDVSCAAYSCIDLITNRFAAGDSLSQVEQEAEQGLQFALKARFGLAADCITGQLRLIRMLRGLTPEFTSFNDAEFDERRFELHLQINPQLAIGACWYWIRRLQACIYANDVASAIAALSHAAPLLWTAPTQFELAEYHFYGALARAAHCDLTSGKEQSLHLEALAAQHKQLTVWAENCPATFANRAALVGAEIARLENRELDAMRLYEEAIRSARANGFVHIEALAYELAARFYDARGFEQIGRVYLRNARNGYLRWGADGKVRQLQDANPQIIEEERALGPTSTISTPVGSLDLATVLKVSEAVSAELVIEKLLDTLMRTAIEQAGAERGLLILLMGAERRITAEAATAGDRVVVELRNEAATAVALPETVLHYVLHTREPVVLEDAAVQDPFSGDPYIRSQSSRSIVAAPLIARGKLIGVLYLENNLARSVFAPARVAVLELIASQAAIALENSRLYNDVAQREAKIRRLVDANIAGIFIWDFEGRILEANNEFLRIIGYDRDDLAAGTLRWTDLTPQEWRDRDEQWVHEHKASGLRGPIEKEYFRKDGTRVSVLLAAATFDQSETEGVAFVLDLSERKRAEEELRTGEARFRTFVDHAADAFFLHGRDGTILDVNRYASESLGYSREELVGMDVKLIDPYASTAVIERMRQRFASKEIEILTFESRHRRKDGTQFPVEVRVREFRQHDQSFALALARDITDRKRAEKALRESEEQWKAVFENNPTMYFMVDASGVIMSVNPFGAEQLGFMVAELVGLPVRDLFHEGDREAVERNMAICFKQPGQTISWETRKIRKDGEVLWVRETARVMLIKDQPVALIVCEDITERKLVSEALGEMQTELEHSNRVAIMGQLTASIAHEVSQPLAATITNAQAALRWLDRPEPDLEELRAALGRIVRDGARGGAVIDRIRALIKKAPPRKDMVDINSAIREVVEVTRNEALKNGVLVNTELADDLPVVHGDRVELQQVLLNLIINAVDAMRDVSERPRDLLIMADKTEADEVLVSVRDSGPGLSPTIRDNLFQAFQTTKPNGLGLGLSICRSIIESHGGRLWASANTTHGTVFQFTLPQHSDATCIE